MAWLKFSVACGRVKLTGMSAWMGMGGLVDSGAADDAGLRLHRAGVYGRHHPDCSRLYVLRWPRALRAEEDAEKQLAEASAQ